MDENKIPTPETEPTNPEEGKKKGKKTRRTVTMLTIIIIIILLLLRCCGSGGKTPVNDEPKGPIGNIVISDEQQKEDKPAKVDPDQKYITFSGYEERTVSADAPNLEFFNPEWNPCYMVFTITDRESGEIIARTDKVAPGEYAYVNVMDTYPEAGVYTVDVDISTSSIEDGSGMNGLSHKIEITVE